MDVITLAVVLVAVSVAIAAVVSGIYIWWVYNQRTEDAPFLTHLVRRNLGVALASAWILSYIAAALSGFSFGRPWGAVMIAVPMIVMMWGVIGDALLWHRERRRAAEERRRLNGKKT